LSYIALYCLGVNPEPFGDLPLRPAEPQGDLLGRVATRENVRNIGVDIFDISRNGRSGNTESV
jgi:hypothetical protein